ncbi:MAG: SDR family NAD(P)-dependent oxidoreductase, partial [Pseudomonadota bacterium]
LFPMVQDSLGLKKSFGLYHACAVAFEAGPAFLVAAVSEDGAFGFRDPAEDGYIAGGVSGATKAFAREFPDSRVRVLDLHPDLTPDKAAAIIARSLTEEFPTETGADADGTLTSIRLAPVTEPIQGPHLKPEEVVLVSGGARGITAACLLHLARIERLTFVILGRTDLSERAAKLADHTPEQWTEEKSRIIERMKREGTPKPVMVDRELAELRSEAEVYRTVRELRRMESEVIYRSTDIRDKEAVDAVIGEVSRLCGRVDLVVHAAGIDQSRALRSKTVEGMEAVVSVKVDGMRNLLDALDRHGMPPGRIVGFGSVSGRFGNMAQVDYSAANDALAHLLRRAERNMDAKISIIDWAPWSEIGMATRGGVQQTLEAAGIDFIQPETGVKLFARDLGRTTGPCEVLAAGRMGPFTVDAFGAPAGRIGEAVRLAGQEARIVSEIPGEYLKVSIMMDPKHPVLDHHRIDRAAVFPGVGAMEVMRSAAALLDPKAADAGFADVRFHGALKVFKSDPIEAFVEVTRTADGPDGETAYAARTFSWFTDPKGRRVGAERLHHEALIVLRPKAPAVIHHEEPWNRYSLVGAKDIYAVFFHGPAFMYLDRLLFDRENKRIKFVFRNTPETPDMFTDSLPAVIEAVFQTAAGYGVDSGEITSLPTGVASVTLHETDGEPAGGEIRLVKESASDKAGGRRALTYDGVVTDKHGRVLVSLMGVEMMELKEHPPFPGMISEEIVLVEAVERARDQRPEEFITRLLTEEEAN